MIVKLPSGGSVTAIVRGSGRDSFLFAHGAGTDQDHRSIVGIADALAERGVRVVTFNYPYTESGRRAPDRPPVLLECHRAVASAVGGPLFLGGRSMGGRIATMLAAEGYPSRGVVLYAYPLHPAGRPEKLRVAHLPEVSVPMLFFRGSRDALSRSDLFDAHIRPLRGAYVVDMEGADHSFREWQEPELFGFLADRTVEWMRAVG
ncbi:MAG: alpha/beta fold hydrolase [Acidimicrobiia bacterium]